MVLQNTDIHFGIDLNTSINENRQHFQTIGRHQAKYYDTSRKFDLELKMHFLRNIHKSIRWNEPICAAVRHSINTE